MKSISEKVLTAIVTSVQKWRHFLWDENFNPNRLIKLVVLDGTKRNRVEILEVG